MVGWALRPCDRREKLDWNCRFGYLVVGWALRPCGGRENLDRNCREVWLYARVIGGRI